MVNDRRALPLWSVGSWLSLVTLSVSLSGCSVWNSIFGPEEESIACEGVSVECGFSAASLSFSVTGTESSTESYIYGLVNRGETSDVTLTVTNTGQVSASGWVLTGLTDSKFNYKDGVFPGTGGTCTDALAGAASCDIVITYTPDPTQYTLDADSATLLLEYNNGIIPVYAAYALGAYGDWCSVSTPSETIINSTGAAAFAFESDYGLMAQSFSVSSSETIRKITLYLYANHASLFPTSTGGVKIGVFQAEGDGSLATLVSSGVEANMSGALATAFVSATLLSQSSLTATDFEFEEPLTLASGTYWLVVDPIEYDANSGLGRYLGLKGSFTDVWSGGSVKIGIPDGGWNSWSYDMVFAADRCTAVTGL